MEPSQFDEFTKAMATPTSRRQALKRLIAGTFGGILALSGIGTAFAKKKCAPGLTNCGGKCVDTTKDPNNCGMCGIVCRSGLCVNGLCCAVGAINCNNSCCLGTCMNGTTCCPTGQACGSTCCPVGQVCLNGTTCCPAQQVCGTTCCPQGQTCQNGMCVKPTCPDNNCTGCAPFNTPPCIDFTCFCYQTTDNNCGCGANIPCAGAQHCSSCGDCPAGSFCAINTGCGAAGVCIPSCLPGMKPGNLEGRTSAIT